MHLKISVTFSSFLGELRPVRAPEGHAEEGGEARRGHGAHQGYQDPAGARRRPQVEEAGHSPEISRSNPSHLGKG